MVELISFCYGCGGEKGIDARYAYEKRVWEARMREERIWLEPLAVRDEDLGTAIAAYESVLAANPLVDPNSESWSPRVRGDIERLRFSSNVALVKLYFIRLQNNSGVTYFRSGVQRHDLLFRDRRDLGLSLVKAIYAKQARDPLEVKCSSVLADIARDEHLWADGKEIGDTLLAVPGYLVHIELDRGEAVPEHVEPAEQLLGRVIAMWPDSLIGQKARLSRVDLYIMLARYEEALADVDAVVASGRFAGHPGEIRLLRGEILAHGLGRYAEAESVFTALKTSYAGTRVSRAASLDLAAMLARRGETREAVEMIRELEMAKEMPLEMRTAAMFLRALIVNESGDWGEAVTLLWRICRLYPFTRAGMVAPLVMLRHELGAGNRESVERVHRKTVEFYLSAIGMDSASLRYRHLVKDYLIESYLLMGDPRGAAMVLEERAPTWSGENGAVGLIKSALIYLNLLDDRENGVRMLEKCLDLFPASRYSGNVRAQLDSLSHRQTVQ